MPHLSCSSESSSSIRDLNTSIVFIPLEWKNNPCDLDKVCRKFRDIGCGASPQMKSYRAIGSVCYQSEQGPSTTPCTSHKSISFIRQFSARFNIIYISQKVANNFLRWNISKIVCVLSASRASRMFKTIIHSKNEYHYTHFVSYLWPRKLSWNVSSTKRRSKKVSTPEIHKLTLLTIKLTRKRSLSA